jgi:hypothetical protein
VIFHPKIVFCNTAPLPFSGVPADRADRQGCARLQQVGGAGMYFIDCDFGFKKNKIIKK